MSYAFCKFSPVPNRVDSQTFGGLDLMLVIHHIKASGVDKNRADKA